MLEHSCLHVEGWTKAEMGGLVPAWIRRIRDASAQPVGFVRLGGDGRGAWFSWLRGVRLEVYETEDASHLMTLVRRWGMLRSWDVYDADERRVGTINPPSLIDSLGERRGSLVMDHCQQGKIVDPANRVLAWFYKRPFLQVNFQPDPVVNPFLRMLVLSSILTLEPNPA